MVWVAMLPFREGRNPSHEWQKKSSLEIEMLEQVGRPRCSMAKEVMDFPRCWRDDRMDPARQGKILCGGACGERNFRAPSSLDTRALAER